MSDTNAQWKPFQTDWSKQFNSHALLFPGNKVKLTDGKIGVITEKKRKNYVVNIDGKLYSVPPYGINEWMEGDFSAEFNIPPQQAFGTKMRMGEKYLAEDTQLRVGDVVLLYRGSFDIARVTSLSYNKIHGISLSGRTAGKSFKWDANMYIQTLKSDRIGNGG